MHFLNIFCENKEYTSLPISIASDMSFNYLSFLTLVNKVRIFFRFYEQYSSTDCFMKILKIVLLIFVYVHFKLVLFIKILESSWNTSSRSPIPIFN